MSEKLIPPRLCGECREPFTPRKPEQQFCPKPARCAYQAMGRQRKGIAPLAAIARRRQMKGESAAAALSARFGELTAREVELYGAGHRDGYNVGYAAAYAPLRVKAS